MRIEAFINYQRMPLDEVDSFEEGLYRIAYYYENWFPPNEYRIIGENGMTMNAGRKQAVCDACRTLKFMPRELHICFTCTENSTL